MENFIGFKTVCRICLDKVEELISIFEKTIDLISYKDMLEECASIQISNHDLLPQSVCVQCSKLLEQSYKLRVQCLISEKILKKYINRKDRVTVESDIEQDVVTDGDIYLNDENQSNSSSFHNDSEVTENNSIYIIKEQPLHEEFSLNESSFLYSNQNQTNKSKEFKCTLCIDTFTSEEQFTIHTEEVHFKTLYKCDVCEKHYLSSSALKLHLYNHENRCKYCMETFKNAQDLFVHVNNHDQKSEYPCSTCGLIFKSKTSLNSHIRVKHVKSEMTTLCPYCGKSFKDRSHLKEHIGLHTGERPYSCKYCDLKFVFRTALYSHMITHTKERKYKCKICHKTYYRNQALKRHLLIHSDEKKFACNVCGRRFHDNGDLRRHLIIHSGLRKYSCTFCNKSFVRNYQLTIHLRTHNGIKPYVCTICEKKFGQKHVLISHMKTHEENT